MHPHLISLLPRLEQGLARFPFPAHPASLYDPIRYFMQLPGKRIRPAFVLMALELFREPTEADILPALSTELFHNFSLVHDDIMDQADMRRGFLTVHKKWDEPTAVLAGDALLVFAYDALMAGPEKGLRERLERFNTMALAVCEGQQLDMDFSQKKIIPVDDYLDMIDRKTAALIAYSFALGGLLAGADTTKVDALHQFGMAMGRCFQMRDDYLDLFGDEAITGKKQGGDIGNCKLTYPVLLSLPHADFQEIWQQRPAMDDTRIARALDWMRANQIPEGVMQRLDSEMDSGMQLLEKVGGIKEAENRLREICHLLAYREK